MDSREDFLIMADREKRKAELQCLSYDELIECVTSKYFAEKRKEMIEDILDNYWDDPKVLARQEREDKAKEDARFNKVWGVKAV